MKIEVLGSGGFNCNDLYSGALGEVVKVSDMMEIAKRGIMLTPALAVDNKVVCAGRVPKYEEIMGLISGGKS